MERPATTNTLLSRFTWEQLLFVLIIALTIFTRFYDLETRVMSHDETQHTYFSWLLYRGHGYTHTPLTHGPLQFHLIAFSYALFGDNDLAARIPHALASVLASVFLWNYRRYLGRWGTLAAASLMLISPYMLYYGRYARNEAFVVLSALIVVWAIFRYLETGGMRYLIYLTLATVLHFAAKETAFIYAAQMLTFLTILLVIRSLGHPWEHPRYRRPFVLAFTGGFLLVGLALGVSVIAAAADGTEFAAPPLILIAIPVVMGLVAFALGLYFAIRGLTMPVIRLERSFDLAMLTGLLVLPQLAALPVNLVGWNPLDYSSTGILRTALFLIPIVLITLALGYWWKRRVFLLNFAIFYGIYVTLYTTLFTNGYGFFTGLVGSLGYWLEQQGVARGSQPWYYYLAIQLPIYEYLPVIGGLVAGLIALYQRVTRTADPEPDPQPAAEEEPDSLAYGLLPHRPYTLALLGFWAITSLLAYTIAGEKMPWLTVHITLPFILLAGWAIGQLVQRVDWEHAIRHHGLLILLLLYAFTRALNASFDALQQVFSTTLVVPPNYPGFLAYVLFAILSGGVLIYLLRGWAPLQFARLVLLAFFGLMAVYTARTAIWSSYIHYDQATEFLVYAHSAPSNKHLTQQIEGLSRRLNGDLSLGVAFDNSDGAGDPGAAWPLTWYLRNFTNTRTYGPDVGGELLDYPVIFASDRNWDRVEPLLRNQYDSFEYIRMWWPMQDYFDLTIERVQEAFASLPMRSALFDIWRDRDYTRYAQQVGRELSIPVWSPSRRMRLYIRKDISAQLWDRGSAPVTIALPEDPYEPGRIALEALTTIPAIEGPADLLLAPRAVALAPDGSLYVADTGHQRILHVSTAGELLHQWGEPSVEGALAMPGTFSEPWGIAVGPDGMVYVSDTWNHRIQKFSPAGEFIQSWGYFGQAQDLLALWGPRGIAVDDQGRVFLADTGNKRVIVFDSEGEPLSVIDLRFNEPVGVAIGPEGELVVADTWNQRLVVAREQAENIFTLSAEWPVDAWFGQSLNNKPYVSVSPEGQVFISDPEGYRIIQFTLQGDFVRTWGSFGSALDRFVLPAGLVADDLDGVWVVDSGANRLMYFRPPEE